jgi:hypothetical protein
MKGYLYIYIVGATVIVTLAGVSLWAGESHNKALPPQAMTTLPSKDLPSPDQSTSTNVTGASSTTEGDNSSASSRDRSELNISVDGDTDILLTDPIGRKAGFDPTTSSVVEDIPGSVHFVDSGEGVASLLGATSSVHVSEPMAGKYGISVIGFSASPYNLEIRVFDHDGVGQPGISLSGLAASGSPANIDLDVETSAGSISHVVP